MDFLIFSNPIKSHPEPRKTEPFVNRKYGAGFRLRNRQEFQRSQLTELANNGFESWAKESYEIAVKFAYRNDGRIGIPKGGAMDCTMVTVVPVLPAGYVVSASRIADRRITLARYRLADLLARVASTLD